MTSVLELVEDGLNRKLNERTVHDLEADTSDLWLEGLWRVLRPLESLTDDDLRSYVPERSEMGLQPYLPYRIYAGGRHIVGDLPVYEGLNSSIGDVAKAAALFARHSLYCNRIVIDDPMWWAVCDGVGPAATSGDQLRPAEGDRERLRSKRESVLGWLALLRVIRPLLESERVVLLPSGFGTSYWQPSVPRIQDPANLVNASLLQDLKREVDELFPNNTVDDFFLSTEEGREDFARTRYHDALEDMILQLRATQFHENRLDLSPISVLHPKALEALIDHGELAPKRSMTASGHAAALTSLITLPAFLDVGDDISRLVDLAKDDAGFAIWRSGMGSALARIAILDPSKSNFDGKVRAAFQDELLDAVTALTRTRNAATWGGALRQNLTALSVSGASTGFGAVLAASAGAPPAAPFALGGAALALGFFTVWTYARGRAARTQGAAALSIFGDLTDNK